MPTTTEAHRHSPLFGGLLALGILLCGVYVISQLQKSEKAPAHPNFQKSCKAYTAIYQQALQSYIQHLRTTRNLFYTNPNVLPEEFSLFARQIIEVYPEIKAIEWVPRIPGDQRQQFEQRMQNSGYPNFEFSELNDAGQKVRALPRPEYFPVYFIEPINLNLSLLGHDLASRKDVYAAMKKARDTGKPYANTSLGVLHENSGEDTMVMILLPVYHSRDIPASLLDKHDQLNGFLLGNVLVGQSFRITIEEPDLRDIEVRISDITELGQPQLLYTHNPIDREALKQSNGTPGLITSSQSFPFASRQWQLDYSMLDSRNYRREKTLIWITIIITALLVFVVAGYSFRRR